jgi:hypothetical protein
MKKILLATGALVLGLTFATTASAHEHRVVVHGHRRVVVGHAYYLDHGIRFAGGYYYRGFDHHHWAYRVWNPVVCRYEYYDPNLQVFYYWSPNRACFYPIGY